MKRVKSLIQEAKDAIRFRGHVMRRFQRNETGAFYTCPCCEAVISVTVKPMPNECELTGDALAVECVGSQLSMYRGQA